ncbi:MAG: sensor histidine kinase, partial [Pseudomonadales bacterium]
TYAVVDLATLKTAVRYFHGASIAIGGSVVVTMIRHWWLCDRSTTLGILNLCLIVLLATGVHDWMFQTGLVGVTGPVSLHLHYYSAPLIFAFITWHLTARFATTMTDLSRLNRELESRVTAAELSLQERYEEIHSMEQQQAVMAERERLAREIHDGVGGNFSNAIMLTELIGRDGDPARVSSLKKLLQDGLADVRQLITTMSGDLSSVESLIRYVTDKADNVLSAAGVSLESTSNNVSQFRSLTQSESLNLVRIFQEAVNNVLKHARASNVLFHCEGYPDGIRIIITDDGVGFSDISETGYGLNNIRRRCLEIAATCRIQSKVGSGSQITIALND